MPGNEHSRPILILSGSYIQTAVLFFSEMATLFPICYFSLKHIDMTAIISGSIRLAHLIHKAKTIDPLGINKRDELYIYNNYAILISFSVYFFLAATPYHVIQCNFCLLFFSIY